MEANIFRTDLTFGKARQFLRNEGFYPLGNLRRIPFKKIILGESLNKVITCEFYYKSELKDDEEIPWLESWRYFFEITQFEKKQFSLNYGCILLSVDNSRYFISYGRAHQTIRKIAEQDFGLDIAERIINPQRIETTNSSFINSNKSRAYTQFKGQGYLVTDVGESSNQVTGKIILEFQDLLLHKLKDSMKFSTSVKIESADIEDQELIGIVGELHYILTHHAVKNPLPRMNILKKDDPQITKLKRLLQMEVYKNELSKFSLQQLVDIGGEQKFPFSEGGLTLYYYKPYELGSYTLEAIVEIIIREKFDNIFGIKIKNESKNESYSLISLLDYSTDIQGTTYSLYDGKWAKLNQSFIEYLHQQVEQVNKITEVDESFNLTPTVLGEGREIARQNPDKYDQVKYAEYPYNIYFENKKQLILLDRKSEHKQYSEIEFADLYSQADKKLTHVKIGGNSEFRACVAQSMNSAKIYSTNKIILNDYGITEVMTIEMLLVTSLKSIIKDGKVDFNNSKSLNFKLELVRWFQSIKQSEFAPKIVVARDARESANKNP
ncbi:DUF6119 family protein [Indiicoccus explosivorum]|uniref:DUF6119 family protein n=1 Tax=Indiicoccus explosivorum TaxID=1917864 RepID=UPI0013901E53|nr:DUF6119 family protein [Indiicoccus explosivorum]